MNCGLISVFLKPCVRKTNNAVLLDLHLGRLNSSAQALNLPWSQNAAEQIQHYIDALPIGLFRVKAALFSDGLALSHAAVSELDGQQYGHLE